MKCSSNVDGGMH